MRIENNPEELFEELTRQIQIAGTVQRELLPSAKSDADEFEIACDYVPVAGVSGDFYDIFSAPGGRMAFVLGDVSGKGIPAALLMGVLHGAVRSSRWMESAPHHREATQNINRLLYERTASNRFATMFWGYFDARSEHLQFINAGHNPPLLFKRGRRNPVLRLQTGGPVLGLVRGAHFDQGSVRLDAGDCLILYSDGIVEASNGAGEEFGQERLLGVVESLKGETAEAIRDGVLDAIAAFAGNASPQDDRTLVIVLYQGPREDRQDREIPAGIEASACAA
jgi:phosphoserine phosphatase RsbU/P